MKKLPIILLSTSLLLGPVTSFADETQQINQIADPKVTEIEFENGDREVNPNKEENKDIKEITEDNKNNKEDKESKEQPKENKEDSKDKTSNEKLGEKDVSKTVDKTPIKLKIVDQVDPTYQEANYITITSEGPNKESITGFSYVLENKTTGEKIDINFKDQNAIIVRGADGDYSLTLKNKPDNFQDEKEMTFKMPYITKKNQNGIDESTRLLQIKPKHILKPEVPKQNPKTSDTKALNMKIIVPIIIAIIAILGYLAYDSKKKKNDK